MAEERDQVAVAFETPNGRETKASTESIINAKKVKGRTILIMIAADGTLLLNSWKKGGPTAFRTKIKFTSKMKSDDDDASNDDR